jgi:hypothetical protein
MDVGHDARLASAGEGATVMAKMTSPVEEPIGLRRCIGSARFGIEPHQAPVEQFPRQPSQRDGLGRMCKSHWNQYTAGLARDAKARRAAAQPAGEVATEVAAG